MERASRRSRIAAEADDDRRRAIGENLCAGVLGIAVHVDQYIDFVGDDLRCGSGIIQAVDIPPAMDRGLYSLLRAVRIADIAAIIGENFKAVLVMQLQNLAKSKAHGMIAKIR